MKEQRMFGLWPSPITPRSLASSLTLGAPCWDSDGRTLAWLEGRSDRGVIVVQEADGGATRDLTPGDLSVRAFVGYGGGDFTLSHGVCYFVAQADQRIYRQEIHGGGARPITPAFGAASTPTVSPDGRWLVYVHSADDVDCLAVVDTLGKHWPAKLASGCDFYMQPAWGHDGKRIAWVEWDHPLMPWDGSELHMADVVVPEGGLPVLARGDKIAGGPSTAAFQPLFTGDGASLIYIADPEGMGQVFQRNLASGRTERISTDETADYGTPAWNHGMRRIASTGAGTLVSARTKAARDALSVSGPGRVPRDLVEIAAEYGSVSGLVGSPDGGRVAAAASGPATPARIIVFDTLSEHVVSLRRRSDGESVRKEALSQPEHVSWKSFDGEEAHGLYYPPASDAFESGGAPPMVTLVHGGPTSQVRAAWDASAQFFATRGYAVLQVNYRGSTGYGRDYMLKLRDSWGIYDVNDCASGAGAMAAAGKADGARLVIMGGSAGGYTVLKSLIDRPGFYRAGVCLFGVSNLFTLAADTHKFEARYLDSLIGPLPEAAALYRERSPIFHADAIVDPIAVFQGDIDRVVPRAQSDAIVASLKARGIMHEYHVYEGEGHGWRKAETIEKYWTSVERFLREQVLFA